MNYIIKEYRDAFVFYLIGSLICAFLLPWLTGPLWLDWVGTFLGAYTVLTIWVVVRSVVLTIYRRAKRKS